MFLRRSGTQCSDYFLVGFSRIFPVGFLGGDFLGRLILGGDFGISPPSSVGIEH